MTRFEIIAKALPLHAQMIAERTYTCQAYDTGQAQLDDLMSEADSGEDAAYILSAAFLWNMTPEGIGYWVDLCDRCKSGHPAS